MKIGSRFIVQRPKTDESSPGSARSLPLGWRRLVRGNRTIAIMAIIAVASLSAGVGLSRLVVSPEDAASRAGAPEAALITAAVETKKLTNRVTFRADATYADSQSVTIPAGQSDAVVTGQVPTAGQQLKPRSVAIEISGRPTIVLPGAFSSYRDLHIGDSGPDVVQLKRALQSVGMASAADPSDVYTTLTAKSVGALYRSVGYSAPVATADDPDAVRNASIAVANAKTDVSTAVAALKAARAPLSPAERVDLTNQVNAAQRALDAITAGDPKTIADAADALAVAEAQRTQTLTQPHTPADVVEQDAAVASAQRALATAQTPASPGTIQAAREALKLAKAQRSEAVKPKAVTAEKAAVSTSRRAEESAKLVLESARQSALPIAPASELLYLSHLPRRIDTVSATEGSPVTGPVFTASGATIQLVGTVDAADKTLLKPGAKAEITLNNGEPVAASITTIVPHVPPSTSTTSAGTGGGDTADADDTSASESGAAGLFDVVLAPVKLSSTQLSVLRGTNVKVAIAVGTTEGKVLAVPLAAVTADANGNSRIEVVEKSGRPHAIEVTTGLAAGGYVQIDPVGSGVVAGQRVVVGR